MNDVLYIGDIPQEYHFARFSNNFIDLFKQPNIQGDLDYYRIYLYDNTFQSEHLSGSFGNFNTFTVTNIQVTDDYHYRRDFPSICLLSFFEICIILIIVNLITSVFKKGGLLSGLL